MRFFARRHHDEYGDRRDSPEYAIWHDTIVPGGLACWSGSWVVASTQLPSAFAVPGVVISLVVPFAAAAGWALLQNYDWDCGGGKEVTKNQAKSYVAGFLLSTIVACSNANGAEISSAQFDIPREDSALTL